MFLLKHNDNIGPVLEVINAFFLRAKANPLSFSGLIRQLTSPPFECVLA